MFSIVTDTSANLGCELLQRHSIITVPLSYCIDGEEHTCLDTVSFDGKAYYDAMRQGGRVITSQVTPETYSDYLAPLLKEGNDILFVGMSSGISGSYGSAQAAAKALQEEYPNRRMCMVDTRSASLGEGLLVMRAVECRERGMSITETAKELTITRQSMCQIFTVDDLNYLRMTGRLTGIQTVIGTMLNIKPILKGNTEGKIVCAQRVRGRKQAIKTLVEQYNEWVLSPDEQTIGIAHADCPEDAEYLKELIYRSKQPKEVMTVYYEPVTGAHVGPGTLALFFLGKPEFRKDKR